MSVSSLLYNFACWILHQLQRCILYMLIPVHFVVNTACLKTIPITGGIRDGPSVGVGPRLSCLQDEAGRVPGSAGTIQRGSGGCQVSYPIPHPLYYIIILF